MTQTANQPFLVFATETLRDAKEPQCRAELCDTLGRYCAVGVLLHRLGYAEEYLWRILHDSSQHEEYCQKLMDAFGTYGYADVDEEVLTKIMELNDDERYTFSEIAAALSGGPAEEGNP